MRGIVDMMSDLTYLKTLYPSTPMTSIQKFKSEKEKTKDGYISIKLKCQIVPDVEDTNLLKNISPNEDNTSQEPHHLDTNGNDLLGQLLSDTLMDKNSSFLL